MAKTTLLTNALLVDCTGGEPRERASVVVEGGRISEVRAGESPPTGGHDEVFDCAGMTLMPGLTDAHVHIGAVDVNILDQHTEHPPNLVPKPTRNSSACTTTLAPSSKASSQTCSSSKETPWKT